MARYYATLFRISVLLQCRWVCLVVLCDIKTPPECSHIQTHPIPAFALHLVHPRHLHIITILGGSTLHSDYLHIYMKSFENNIKLVSIIIDEYYGYC